MNQVATPIQQPESPILRTCRALGGQAELARLLSVTPAAVNQWCTENRPIPAERCPVIERLTRERHALEPAKPIVTCEELRPDVAWDVLRLQIAPKRRAKQPTPTNAQEIR